MPATLPNKQEIRSYLHSRISSSSAGPPFQSKQLSSAPHRIRLTGCCSGRLPPDLLARQWEGCEASQKSTADGVISIDENVEHSGKCQESELYFVSTFRFGLSRVPACHKTGEVSTPSNVVGNRSVVLSVHYSQSLLTALRRQY